MVLYGSYAFQNPLQDSHAPRGERFHCTCDVITWTSGKKCRLCRKLIRKELMRFEALRKKANKMMPKLKGSHDGLKDELNQRIENEGAGEVVSWMK